MSWLIQIHNVALKDSTPMIAPHVDSSLMIQLYALEVQSPLLEYALETAEVSGLIIGLALFDVIGIMKCECTCF